MQRKFQMVYGDELSARKYAFRAQDKRQWAATWAIATLLFLCVIAFFRLVEGIWFPLVIIMASVTFVLAVFTFAQHLHAAGLAVVFLLQEGKAPFTLSGKVSWRDALPPAD